MITKNHMMRFSLEGKVAIVTGAAAGGIGEAYARGLAEAGASVLLADIRADAAEAAAKKLANEGLATHHVRVDITKPDSAKAMVEYAVKEFGGLDILVNNAALMAEISYGPIAEYPLDEWNRIMSVNLTGALVCTQAAVPALRARGGGSIVNQTSNGAWAAPAVYSISKLGIVGLTISLARQLGKDGIRVNAIAPGITASDAGRRLVPKDSPFLAAIEQAASLQAVGEPDDLVGALLFAVSPAGKWMTGQVLIVDGGVVMRT
jgi:NAD(P)-dependent dehydrogenase (short-subunit alcohol dehydrogenase family)